MNKLPCEVVRDLLPSYVDGLTSEMTNRLVDEHIGTCAPCRAALDAMRAPEAAPDGAGEEREIDYLRKNRRRNRIVALLSAALALVLALSAAALRLFAIGDPLSESAAVARELRVADDRLSFTLKLSTSDSARSVAQVTVSRSDGVVTLEPTAVLSSALHRGECDVTYQGTEPVRRICVGGRVLWDDGAEISASAAGVFSTRHDYVGDMPANGRTANALELTRRFGPYENELRTSERPYCWTLRLQTDVTAGSREWMEKRMEAAACAMLAVIGNLDEVRFVYTADGAAAEKTVTAADATEYLGQDVKACYESPRLLDELICKAGLEY